MDLKQDRRSDAGSRGELADRGIEGIEEETASSPYARWKGTSPRDRVIHAMSGGPTGPELFIVSDARRVRCLAGPGTGKSRALQLRVERLLLERGIPGSRIFAVTFTRKAAAQLTSDLAEVETPGAADVRAFTLHSYAFRLLNREDAITALGRTPRPCLPFELDPLHHDMAPDFGGVHSARKFSKALDAMWARLQTDEPGSPRLETDRAFETKFIEWMEFHQSMAIGELVPLAVRFLTINPVNSSDREFDQVIVDEYQDLNRADQRLIDLIGANGTVAIVGDDDQSIYRFRHANPEGIRDWIGAQTARTEDVRMNLCHRCDGRIISASNSLISRNPGRVRGDLVPEPGRETNGEVTVVQWASREAETRGLALGIHMLLGRHPLPSSESLIVVVPRHEFGVLLKERLDAEGVSPVKLHTPLDWDEHSLQRAATLFILANCPDDRVALRAWLGAGNATWRREAYRRLRNVCDGRGLGLMEALNDSEVCRTARIPALVRRWHELQAELARLTGLSPVEQVDRLFAPEGSYSEIGQRLKDALRSGGPARPSELLAAATLGPEEDSLAPGVNIMTFFASKGLTCDTVVVSSLVNGLLPRNPVVDTGEDRRQLEEDRRQLYVAITRARHRVVLSSFRSATQGENAALKLGLRGRGYRLSTQASVFLGDLGPTVPPSVVGDDWLSGLVN
jgi:DNA helicase II / ATP-dependent DNA helicase PcrA